MKLNHAVLEAIKRYPLATKIVCSPQGHSGNICDYQIRIPNAPLLSPSDGCVVCDGEIVPHWYESESTMWAKIKKLSETELPKIWLLHGALAPPTGQSNGDNTFLFFDDFTTLGCSAKWDEVGSATVTKVFETLFTAAHGGQGLACDGPYFYFGKDNGVGVDGTTYKIRRSDGAEITSFTSPPHSALICIRKDHDTILVGSGGSETPEVWEINKNTGVKIREWDFAGEGYNRGAGPIYKSDERIYLFSSDASYNFKIQEYQINDNGTWAAQGIEYAHTSLGVPQGAEYVGGYIYYLYDNGISKLQLNGDGSITVLDTLADLPGTEREGLAYCGGYFYYGDSDLNIRKIHNQMDMYGTAHGSLYSKSAAYGVNTALEIRWYGTSTQTHHSYPGFGYGDKTQSNILADSSAAKGAVIGKLYNDDDKVRARTRTDTDVGDVIDLSQSTDWDSDFKRYAIKRRSASVRYEDEGTDYEETDNIPTTDLYIGIGGYYTSDDGYHSIADYIFVRKYIYPEPVISLGETILSRNIIAT